MLIPESSNFETIINYFNFAAWIFFGATFAALLWLRFKKPNLDRPYKVNFEKSLLIWMIVAYFLNVLGFSTDGYKNVTYYLNLIG